MIGQTISHYKILEKLGEGGMGIVYKAQDMKLDRFVALKFLPHHVVATEAEQSRFLQEAKSAALLNHPNVCVIHSIEDVDGKQFIVMEYVEGKTLRRVIEEHSDARMKINDAITYATQIGDALQEAHGKGIIHRDIKSENIMVNAKNQIKVMDFGLAKLKGSLKLTRSSSTAGTLGYMAPEQLQGGEIDARSDIFSFGVLLFEMLTGKLPFRGEHEAAIMYSIVNEEPEPITKYLPDISPSIMSILEKVLEKNPDDRYQSVGEMVVDLRRSRKDSTRLSRAHHAVALSAGQAQQDSPPAPPARRRNLVYITGGVMIVVAVAAYLIGRSLSPANEETSFANLKISRLTSDGRATDVAISPDGKYIAYARSEKDKQSLFLRQVSTTGNVAISPPTDNYFLGLTFSPNGDFLYYVSGEKGTNKSNLFQVPVLGGAPRAIKQNVNSRIAFTSDGKHIIFLRDSAQVTRQVVKAGLDGNDETVLVRRHSPEHLDDIAISPDGKSIAMIEGKSGSYLNHRILIHSPGENGESLLPNQSWLSLTSIDWMGDGRGIILTAADHQSSFDSPQIWILPYPHGVPRRITNDLNNYFAVRLSSRSNVLAALASESYSNLFTIQNNIAASARQLTEGTKNQNGMKGLRWLGDGRVIYTSRTDGYDNLWVTGGSPKQITSGSFTDMNPVVLPGEKSVIFVSNRQGVFNLWRCDLDGSDLRQITQGNYDVMPSVTPDGRWILYWTFGDNSMSLCKTTPDGDSTQLLVKRQTIWGVLSPDGKRVAYGYYDNEQKQKLVVMEFPTLRVLTEFEFPYYATRWTPNGTSIAYLDMKEGVSNVWSQDLDGGKPRQLTGFSSGVIFDFDWTTDGKQLVVSRGESSTDVVLFTAANAGAH